ncbi:hypothetical protein D1007_29545 [Hordeum vulgare]|nr:hypothetical protein D1007_29545 [Hordeum vulgare]
MTVLLVLAVAATAAPLAHAACADGSDGAMLHGVANDVLLEYGLPKGLLPDSVVSYTFDNATGNFHIELANSCYVWFGDHYVYFDKNLSGTISHGEISNLSGIMAKKFFIWVSITSMVAHLERGMIEFHAGIITEDVPASLFQKIPVCGKGLGEPLRGAAGVIRELGLVPVAEGGVDGSNGNDEHVGDLDFDLDISYDEYQQETLDRHWEVMAKTFRSEG